jgi:putative DNA primase/helicase
MHFRRQHQSTGGWLLKDPTGARRFWPVACHGTIDRDGLEKVRDRLWAEAVHRYKAGEPWWLETPEREALAIAEQDARFATDIWEEPIKKWLGDRQETDVHEVLGKALRLGRKDQTQSAWTRVSRILTHLGFSKYRPTSPTSPTGRANRYRRDPVATKKLDE